MDIHKIVLNGNHYRYAAYRHQESDQFAVFLLGALQDIESVQQFSLAFASHLNVFTIEVPGTGRTAPLDSTISIRQQALMLKELLDHLGVNQAHVMGFSYATAVAVELVDIWPNVLSLSICGGVPGIPSSGRLATKQMIAAAMHSPNHFAQSFTHSLTIQHPDIPRNKAIIRATEREISKMHQERIDVFFENSVRLLVHTPTNVKNINIPCTICVGEYDPYVTKEVAYEFASALKNSHFVVIKNADHLVHLQHPETVAAIMIAQAASAISLKRTLANLI
ncbi:alpha/beta hydrolase [Vibrio vulnificus]|uniref:alpha/beta fold hydrolase n=1 Tax=Vibrio vulnificus TaxID=672 RepID=UPI001A2F4DD7|nr:alpha/beta hydrolase [Vibrio vulnificus]MDS1860161.1 alpha/beta hydrolase [Vibrio vulnificus]HAS6383097.1 alpha/beta fold hydrolase [Vibrio vulnificus]HDY7622611.1 alpha/beta hydrolase [Vibrio vulnificus]HEB2779999.1 alpha/beta hydrolase [Vibrio vulnificus]HEB2784317.1 alpha/beta hydrolase [Vibrio vulnificus]